MLFKKNEWFTNYWRDILKTMKEAKKFNFCYDILIYHMFWENLKFKKNILHTILDDGKFLLSYKSWIEEIRSETRK